MWKDLDAACRCLHCWNMNCMKYLFLLALKPFERMVSAIGGCVFSATDGLWSGTYIGDGLLPYPKPIRFQPTFWSMLFLWSWGLEATSFFCWIIFCPDCIVDRLVKSSYIFVVIYHLIICWLQHSSSSEAYSANVSSLIYKKYFVLAAGILEIFFFILQPRTWKYFDPPVLCVAVVVSSNSFFIRYYCNNRSTQGFSYTIGFND